MGMERFLPGSRRRLMREGARANAVVVKSDAIPSQYGIWGFRLLLEVHFDDGTKTEIERTEQILNLGTQLVGAGDIVPVRYDPQDRNKVEVDSAAMQAAHDAQTAQRDQAAVHRAEAELAGERAADEQAAETRARGLEEIQEIVDLKKAHDAGTISDAEFEARKAAMKEKLRPGLVEQMERIQRTNG
jgi:hypothetical protein